MKRTQNTNGNKQIILITGMQEKILRELATYKFLTVSQLIKLNVGIKNRIYENLKKLVDAGLVKYADYKALLRYGNQLERIHFLTAKGATLLVENTPNLHLDSIRYPKSSTTLFTHDYFHRVSSINTQISFMQWLSNYNFPLIAYHSYFDMVGSRKKHSHSPMYAVTRIDFGNGHFLDPDGIGVYENNEKAKITLFETYNGNDSKRVIEQLRKHLYVIKHGLAAEKYKVEAPTRVCCTFENYAALQNVLKRIEKDPYFQFDGLEFYVFFGVAEQVWQDFERSFYNIFGVKVHMSNLKPVNL